MSDKITLQTIGSLQNQTEALTKINSNFDDIAEKIDTLLSRDGDTPNQMESNLDMNSYKITNLPAPVNTTEPARLAEIQEIVSGGIPAGSIDGDKITNNSLPGDRIEDATITSDKIAASAYATIDDFDQSATDVNKIVKPWVQRVKMRRFMIDPYDWKTDYGALFNGTGTGSGDRQAIQAAINYGDSIGGAEIRMPAIAKINSSSNPLIGKGKVVLCGQGRGASRLLGDGTGTLISIGGSTTVDRFRGGVRELQLDSAERAIDVSYRTAGWDFDELYIAGIKYPVRIKGKYDGATVGDTYDAINFHLSRIEIEGLAANGVGIELIHCGEVYIDQCKTPSPSGTGTVAMQVDTAVTSVQTRGNNWTGCAYGLIHRNTYGFPSGNPRSLPGEPRENWFSWDRFDSGGVGAQIEAGYDIRFDNSWACGNTVGEGFLIGGGSLVRRISFANPIVKGNRTHGLRTVDGLSNIDLTIEGGEFVSNGNAGANTNDNIYIGNSNTHFSINTKSYSTSATGLNNVTRNGIFIGTGCDNYSINGDIQACLTSAINDSSSATATHRSVGSLNGSMKQRWLVNTVEAATSGVATTTTATPYDNTTPTISEGGEFITLSYQPRDVNNRLLIWVDVTYSHTTTTWVTVALHAGGAAIAAKPQYIGNSGAPYSTSFMHEMVAGTTSPISFSVRIGGSTGSTLTFNGVSGSPHYGGVGFSRLRIQEVAP